MDKQQRKVLQEHGISWEVMTKGIATQAKATYYGPDGVPMPNLPADSSSLKKYLARGYTLTPPENPVPMPVVQETAFPIVNDTLVSEILAQNKCETCGKILKTKLALAGHKRSHDKSK